MSPKTSNVLAALIIALALALMIFSVRGDSVTTDESPHVSAGYSYLYKKDMRLNPEHPPLVKDLAALPLLFQNINFDSNHPSWRDNINDQWSFGPHFLYEIGNNPDKIAFSARLAVMVLFVLLGLMVYKWGRERYGPAAGLLALFMTALSPNIIAHGRYVTTDTGAAFAFVTAVYFFVKFAANPSKKNLVYAGLAFGLAQLLKFSLFLLIPLYVFTLLAYQLAKNRAEKKVPIFRGSLRQISRLIIIFAIGYLLVWPVYQFHVWNYPPERQKNDTEFILSSYPFKPAAAAVVWMADKPVLRPYAQYLLGLMMVFQRAGGGNTTYFTGEVSSTAWKSYFPLVYLLKEPIPILLLVLIAIYSSTILQSMVERRKMSLIRLGVWVIKNFAEFVWISFIVLYWTTSVTGNLNIGLRHILPTFPFIYLLTAGRIKKWMARETAISLRPLKLLVAGVLLLWLTVETAATYPFYLAYFNEFAGGPANGYKYVADSNLDWGQDLKRLAAYVNKNNIDKIKLDYFGGGSPAYYLGDKYEKLDAGNVSQRNGWLAVSATLLQGGRARAAKGFDQNTTYYRWLDNREPSVKIGYSIFVYRIEAY